MPEPATESVENISQHVGQGTIHLVSSHGNLHLSDLSFTYPLKLVAPKASRGCQSVFILSYGGGLVGGDAITLFITLDRATSLALMTQGSTKLFKRRPGLPATRQSMHVTLQAHATCLLVPDPVQPFAHSAYLQTQRFDMYEDSTLILLDWVISGRPANGECWDFEQYTSINTVYAISNESENSKENGKGRLESAEYGEGRMIARDCQNMQFPQTKRQMGHFNCLATLLFTGPRTKLASQYLLTKFKNEDRVMGNSASRKQHHDARQVQWTVTQHRGVTILKAVGQSSEQVKDFLCTVVDECCWRTEFGSDAFRALDY